MATLTISVSDELLNAFRAKYPGAHAEEALTAMMIDLVQNDPYSADAHAEDERRYQDYLRTGKSLSTAEVLGTLTRRG